MIRKLIHIKYNLRNRKIWTTLVFIFMVLSMLMTYTTCVMSAEKQLTEKRLYIYSFRELANFIKDIGYQDLWYNDIRISRNSDGTALRFMNEDKRKIIIVTCDGSVKVMDSPGNLAWLNDANQVIVWVAWTDNKSVAYYADGTSEKTPFSPEHGPDPSGKYFIKGRLGSSSTPLNESCYTSIYATEKPNMPLTKVDVCGITKIFYKDNKVFLTGRRYRDNKWQGEEIRIFRETGNILEPLDRVTVPDPNEKSSMLFYAMDLSPWNDEVLYLDAHDFPSRSIWYSFNVKTRQLNKVSKEPFFGGVAFYLQCDIIKKVTEMKKTK